MCASAAQRGELLAEIDRLNGTIETLHAARGGALMDEAAVIAARSPPSRANTVPQAADAIAAALPTSRRTTAGGYVQCVNKVPCKVQQVAKPTASSTGDLSAVDQAAVDIHLSALLLASGSALRHYSLPNTLANMRAAMLNAMKGGA
jgi:hypothetical protein